MVPTGMADDAGGASQSTMMQRILRIPAACRAHDPWGAVLSGRRKCTRLTPYRRVVELAVVSLVVLIAAGVNTSAAVGLIAAPITPFGSWWLTLALASMGVLLFIVTWLMPTYAVRSGPDAALTPVPQVFVLAASGRGRRRGVLAIARFVHHGSSLPIAFGLADGTSLEVERTYRFLIASPRDLYRSFRRPALDVSREGYTDLDESELAVLAAVWNGTRVGQCEIIAASAIESELESMSVDVPEGLHGLRSRSLIRRRRHGVLHRTDEYQISEAGAVVLAQRLRDRGDEIYMGANREQPVTITNGSGVVVVGGSNTTVTQTGDRSWGVAHPPPLQELRALLDASTEIASHLDRLDRADFSTATTELEDALAAETPDEDRLTRATRATLRIGRDVGASVVGAAVWAGLATWAGL